MEFKWEINLGTILTLIGTLVTIIKMHNSNVSRVQHLETKLDLMFDWFRKMIMKG